MYTLCVFSQLNWIESPGFATWLGYSWFGDGICHGSMTIICGMGKSSATTTIVEVVAAAKIMNKKQHTWSTDKHRHRPMLLVVEADFLPNILIFFL